MTLAAARKSGRASEAARALSRLAFQHSMTVFAGSADAPTCGTTSIGRPVDSAMVSGRSSGVKDGAPGSA